MSVVPRRTVVLLILSGLLVDPSSGRPSQDGLFNLEDSRRPVYRGIHRTRGFQSDEFIVKSMISVNESGSGRGTNAKPTRATPMGESFKTVTNQLLQAPEATDMVAADIRTPPRVKIHRTDGISPQGQGEAFPITLEDTQSSTQKTVFNNKGNSSWILLTNANKTLANKKKISAQLQSDQKVPNVNEAVEDIATKTTDANKFDRKPPNSTKPTIVGIKKQNTTKEESLKTPGALFESKLKNRTQSKLTSVQKDKSENNMSKQNATLNSNKEIPVSKNKTAPTTPTTPTVPTTPIKNIPVHLPDIVPTTSLLIETGTIDVTDDTTTETPSTTTKQTRRPGTKKKKKNKNRRRRPTKSGHLESKITPENSSNSSKIDGNGDRPLSTRIYNYLAREVMPSVGVGIVGLVLTAGLAGLLLYPFGGGIARRNYDKISESSPDGHMYYYNDYAPGADPNQGSTQPEETVFGQVLSGLNLKSYPNTYDSQKYNTNNYRYDHYDYNNANINSYAGSSEYSTLPESVKNTDYSNLSENNKFFGMDNANSQQKIDTTPQADQYNADNNMNYPELTKYTAYTNAASVGTSGTYEKMQSENKKDGIEDKSDKSQPQFSALVGSPQFTGYVGSVSVSGSYGTDHHRQGALALEHGPRSLDIKSRKVRDVTDDFPNEIDDSYDTFHSNSQPESVKPHENFTYNKSSSSTALHNTAVEPGIILNKKHSNGTSGVQNEELNTPISEINNSPNQEAQFSFTELFRKVAHMKLKLGINFLRSTADTFQRYLDNITARMETAMHNLEESSSPQQLQNDPHKFRNKRDLKNRKKHGGKKVVKKIKLQ